MTIRINAAVDADKVRECNYPPAALDWYAVYVKSRHEFFVCEELGRKDIETFLPSVRKKSQWTDRKKIIEFPLFPGYVFVHAPCEARAFIEVLKTRGVVSFIALEPGKPTPIVPEEIAALRLVVASGKAIDVYPHLREGTRVRVKSGPLQDAEGIVTRKDHEYIFQVNIELLGRSVAVKIAAEEIEAV